MDARSLALKRIGVREYSAAEMKRYLKRKGFDETEIDEAVAQLIRENYINDSRYTKAIVRHQSARGKGPRYIQAKLAQKGVKISATQVDEVQTALGASPTVEQLKEILERKYPGYESDRKIAARAYQGLLRRGFSTELVRRAIFKN